ncbi:sulfurtransferase [Corynebacterium sp. ES2794-CONJ1]|uniref:sulfurtransferase n=1 Tax=unclassified Corynebacterium TaxID=2624378 RepID=UPI0021699532|nr:MULTISPECIES: sulfurtransferase [unclassified Corynebacterium]MCS4489516.1 sulfurtransferase [Corynebacterium sp. ES2775-CONJ]MCS4491473.1 sulfurtransferase [Corynebacterium sp. ES2715-CONJ3]MCS4531426.1 sulfurtransferase [Corynebacterium sp. ES2730-CONJ]MCU9518814.1 sulfurtransferase [Corynebacterium sp. ES2794-CONJ1]
MALPFDPYPPFREFAHPERIVSSSWLSAHLGTPGLCVIESDEGKSLYNIGHLPGAIRIDWGEDLNDPLAHDFISSEQFAQLMRKKGISRDDTVVIYGERSNWWAAYTLWIFELFGHPDVRLLDGGRDAWILEERDISFDIPHLPESDYPVVARNDELLRAFVEEVAQVVTQDQSHSLVVDARSNKEYQGLEHRDEALDLTERQGHIPGAVNIPWEKALYANGRFRKRSELANLYHDLVERDEIIVYCSAGNRAALTWFVLKYLLGKENTRLYDGSWLEWSNMVRKEVRRGPHPFGTETT